ncbi:hypothetical protein D3C87_1339760 [compost metagenome]
MQHHDAQHHEEDRQPEPLGRRPQLVGLEGQGGEQHRADHGDDHIGDRPLDHGVDGEGGHADEMHRGHAQAEQDAADQTRSREALRGQQLRRPRPEDGDQQRQARQARLIGDLKPRLIGDHGDEVGAPDRGAARHRAQEDPGGARAGPRAADPLQQADGDPAAQHADKRGQGHQRQVMGVGQTIDDTHGIRGAGYKNDPFPRDPILNPPSSEMANEALAAGPDQEPVFGPASGRII